MEDSRRVLSLIETCLWLRLSLRPLDKGRILFVKKVYSMVTSVLFLNLQKCHNRSSKVAGASAILLEDFCERKRTTYFTRLFIGNINVVGVKFLLALN